MEKRLLYAFVITLVFLAVYSRFMAKYFPQIPVQQGVVSESPPKIEEKVGGTENIQAPTLNIEQENVNLPKHAINDFIITYSPTGGYIKEIAIGDEENKLPFKNIGFVEQDQDKEFLVNITGEKIVFKGPGNQKKEFIFEGNTVIIKTTPPISGTMIIFSNHMDSSMLDQRYQEAFYSQNSIIERKAPKKIKEKTLSDIEFAGARDRYYCLSLVKGLYEIGWLKEDKVLHLYLPSPPPQVQIYIGPQTEEKLKPYELQGIIYYGFFHIIGAMMIKLLYFFHFLTKNWGVSIIGFAIFIYFILFPFTSKSTKAMRRMQQIQPETEEIKKKYKDNPQKMQKATMELYKKYKINPLGGCLPLVFQLPIFIALYQVLFRFVELKGAKFLWIKDLASPDHFLKLPFPPPVEYLNILPIMIVCIGLLQQKITTSSSSSSEQKKMGLFFSVFLGVIFYKFPSALVLYWFVQNLLTLAYQTRISRAQPNIA